MKDLLYSSELEDQLNFEADFDLVPVNFGSISGQLKSITDIKVNNTVLIEFSTNSTWAALSMVRGDYPENVIIRFGGKEMPFNVKVNSFKVGRETGETIVQIGGEYVKE